MNANRRKKQEIFAIHFPLAIEIATGSTSFVDQYEAAFIPITGAHILSAIVGIVVGITEDKSEPLRVTAGMPLLYMRNLVGP